MKIHDVVIIGAGPAGLTAAIQLQRAGHSPLLLERGRAGGLLLNANLVENYPGFPNGITGEKLAEAMVQHLERTGARITAGEILSLRRDSGVFLLEGGDNPLKAKSVIVSTGTRAIVPSDLPLPSSMMDRYIYTELKDVAPKSNDRAAIIGGGDCAFDYALNLSSRGYIVSILHRGNEPEALPLLAERVETDKSIEYLPGVTLKDVEEEEGGITLRLRGGSKESLRVELLMLAVGREPENAVLPNDMRDDLGRGVRIRGLHLAGDIRRGFMRQAGIAVGDGLVAAMEICRMLKGTV